MGIKNSFSKLINKIKLIGLFPTFIFLIRKLIIIIFRIDEINNTRYRLSNKFMKEFNGIVKYGILSGFKLSNSSWWGDIDRASMLFGLYEKEVLESLKDASKNYTHLIDLGAADGYYGVGTVKSGLFDKATCYEISLEGQKVITESAMINGVGDNIVVKGEAKTNFYKDIGPSLRKKSILFVDIEGDEFNLLTKETFQAFKDSIIIIELHNWLFSDSIDKLESLRLNITDTHFITNITTSSRDLSLFPELVKLSDNERWLMCSEGRGKLMQWLRLDPKK